MKTNKIKTIIAAVLICAGGFALTAALLPSDGGVAAEAGSLPYVVRAVDDKVCVFRDGDESPFIETGIEASRLRYVDYMELCEGIEVDNLESALMLLEDFGS